MYNNVFNENIKLLKSLLTEKSSTEFCELKNSHVKMDLIFVIRVDCVFLTFCDYHTMASNVSLYLVNSESK